MPSFSRRRNSLESMGEADYSQIQLRRVLTVLWRADGIMPIPHSYCSAAPGTDWNFRSFLAMSGHSKWKTIKHQKGVADARRGQAFTRLGREIAIAAREGGGHPDSNFKLRLAMDKARAQSMPKENVERAIRRRSREDKAGVTSETMLYQAYGP